MKVIVEVELQPFKVPNFAKAVPKVGRRQDGFHTLASYRLCDVDAVTLEKMCADFRNEVFQKAGKGKPPEDATC